MRLVPIALSTLLVAGAAHAREPAPPALSFDARIDDARRAQADMIARAQKRSRVGRILVGVGLASPLLPAIVLGASRDVTATVATGATAGALIALLVPIGAALWSDGASEQNARLTVDAGALDAARYRKRVGTTLLAIAGALTAVGVTGGMLFMFQPCGRSTAACEANFYGAILMMGLGGGGASLLFPIGAAVLADGVHRARVAVAPTGIAFRF